MSEIKPRDFFIVDNPNVLRYRTFADTPPEEYMLLHGDRVIHTKEVLPCDERNCTSTKLTEDYLENLIMKWQRKWMDVKGTDERDRKSYFEKSAGIDANMRYSLARMLREEIMEETGE